MNCASKEVIDAWQTKGRHYFEIKFKSVDLRETNAVQDVSKLYEWDNQNESKYKVYIELGANEFTDNDDIIGLFKSQAEP